jgi:hypothetical protein
MVSIYWNMRRKQDFIVQRENFNYEYTYQKLFNKPSNFWALKNGQQWNKLQISDL